jgi:hypothetical protein
MHASFSLNHCWAHFRVLHPGQFGPHLAHGCWAPGFFFFDGRVSVYLCACMCVCVSVSESVLVYVSESVSAYVCVVLCCASLCVTAFPTALYCLRPYPVFIAAPPSIYMRDSPRPLPHTGEKCNTDLTPCMNPWALPSVGGWRPRWEPVGSQHAQRRGVHHSITFPIGVLQRHSGKI